MAYLNNIPTGPQRLKDSQPQIQNNFFQIKELIDINHVTFDDPAGNHGKHKWVSFPVQVAEPVFLATEEGLYNKVPAAPFPLTGVQELFVHKQIFGPASVEVPMTASILSTVLPLPNVLSNGWTYLPSGIIMQWGYGTTAADLNGTLFNFTTPFPTACLNVQLTVVNNVGVGDINDSITLQNFAPNFAGVAGFYAVGNRRAQATFAKAVPFTYLAIGY